MKKDVTTQIYKDIFNIDENHNNINKIVKAVIINFGDERGDIIVKNDNFGTRRKYACFTEGGKEKQICIRCKLCFVGLNLPKFPEIDILTNMMRYVSFNNI